MQIEMKIDVDLIQNGSWKCEIMSVRMNVSMCSLPIESQVGNSVETPGSEAVAPQHPQPLGLYVNIWRM